MNWEKVIKRLQVEVEIYSNKDFCTALSWPKSKLSKIANNQQNPSWGDIVDLSDLGGILPSELIKWGE